MIICLWNSADEFYWSRLDTPGLIYMELTESHKFLDWYFLACYPCEAVPSPCDIKWQKHIFSCFSPPSLGCLLEGTPWHFKSLLFCLSRHLPHWEICPWGTLQMFFFFFKEVICIEITVKKYTKLHLFIWTFSFYHSQCSLNVKLEFCQTGNSTIYLGLLKHAVP